MTDLVTCCRCLKGTYRHSRATPPKQQVWNQSPSQDLAGGGGPSTSFDRPDYQQNTGLDESKRQTPDIAFLANPSDVGPIAVCSPGAACQFETVAGTSATAPGVTGALALIQEQAAKAGKQTAFGLLNPSLYYLATNNKGANDAVNKSIFTDITEGNNDLFNTGCCTARPGYDMASGWGSMTMSEFAVGLDKLRG